MNIEFETGYSSINSKSFMMVEEAVKLLQSVITSISGLSTSIFKAYSDYAFPITESLSLMGNNSDVYYTRHNEMTINYEELLLEENNAEIINIQNIVLGLYDESPETENINLEGIDTDVYYTRHNEMAVNVDVNNLEGYNASAYYTRNIDFQISNFEEFISNALDVDVTITRHNDIDIIAGQNYNLDSSEVDIEAVKYYVSVIFNEEIYLRKEEYKELKKVISSHLERVLYSATHQEPELTEDSQYVELKAKESKANIDRFK
jgi:hypothetical protein